MTYTIKAARIERVDIEQVPDYDPDLSYLEQDYKDPNITAEEAAEMRAQDAERLAAYNRGEWYCVGVRAIAEIVIPTSVEGGWIIKSKIVSPGLWGIESDSEDGYLEEIGKEELAQLYEILRDGFRFPADELVEHFQSDNVEGVI